MPRTSSRRCPARSPAPCLHSIPHGGTGVYGSTIASSLGGPKLPLAPLRRHAMEATARDGSIAEAEDEGIGTPVLVVHGGMGDRTTWKPVTDLLNQRFRTVRLHRRQYRLDVAGPPVTMAQEVEHVSAIAAQLDRPVLVGHSSGGVLALEALVTEPEAYAAAVLYEPPIRIGDRSVAPLRRPPARPWRRASRARRSGYTCATSSASHR